MEEDCGGGQGLSWAVEPSRERERERVHLEELNVAQLLKKFPAYYGTQGSLPCSEESDAGPYPEPDEFNPPLPTPFL
jgi:hypothetical protein